MLTKLRIYLISLAINFTCHAMETTFVEHNLPEESANNPSLEKEKAELDEFDVDRECWIIFQLIKEKKNIALDWASCGPWET